MAASARGKVRILSTSGQPFRDRQEAGTLLAAALMKYRGKKPVVLGIPRGGIAVAHAVAGILGGELDIVLAHKLRTPGQPELAMGSVAEDGQIFLNDEVVRSFGISDAAIQRERAQQLEELKRRTAMFRHARPKVPLGGRVVIITDDGVATGATTQAAIWAARMEKPQRLILAMPVGPDDTIDRLSRDVDEAVCLRSPPFFSAVGQFYMDFEPVSDEEVVRTLRLYAGGSK